MTMLVPLGSIEDVVFHASNVLRIPVLVAALLALVLVLAEVAALIVEFARRPRRRRDAAAVENASRDACDALARGDRELARRSLAAVASSGAMWAALERMLAHVGTGPASSPRMSKCLADFDLRSMRRLERTRMLVRAGPALGLMGTLIPLSPALTGLANGNTGQLTANLRVAFSVTVLGLMIGAIAFAISLVRDRLYAQDLSDMESIASELELDPRLVDLQLVAAEQPLSMTRRGGRDD
jgi:biopolymer transport protein ExbB/TolQ